SSTSFSRSSGPVPAGRARVSGSASSKRSWSCTTAASGLKALCPAEAPEPAPCLGFRHMDCDIPVSMGDLKKVGKLIEKVEFAMLITEDGNGRLHSRPMATAEIDG